MMEPEVRNNIKRHIERSGYYALTASGGPTPRWSYTIGLSETLGRELLFAGGIDFMLDDVLALFETYAATGEAPPAQKTGAGLSVREVHETWGQRLTIGVAGYYGTMKPSLQLFPKTPTIDTPDTSLPYSTSSSGAFRWVEDPWAYPVPPESEAMTNLAPCMANR